METDVGASGPSLREYVAVLSRRRMKMLTAFGIGILLTLLIDIFYPARYQSIGTILIEQQEMPTELVRSTVTSYADQRVQVISQRVMTTQTLLDIIRRYNLYPKVRDRESREALMKRMREDISVKMISADVIDPRSGRPTSATIAFSVGYANRVPEQAARVANELTTLFLNENLTTRTRLAEEATTFLGSEAGRVSHNIEELEAKLAAFKAKNLESLPDLMQLNMQLLDRTQQELDQTETRKSSLEQQRVYLEAQLAVLKPNSVLMSDTGERILSTSDRLKTLRSQLASARALYAPDHPDIARYEREIAGLEGEDKSPANVNDLRRSLEEAQAAAADASKRYSPEHPDRIRAERQVTTLQEELDAAVQGASARGTERQKSASEADNPAYIQIESQLEATKNDLAALVAQQSRLRAEVNEYQRKITVSPRIEKEYRELTRDYENARLRYAELSNKQGEATVARNLESDRKGERFTLIEPPLVPEEPVSPNRVLVTILGIILSIGLAIGTAALLEALDGTVRGRRDLVQLVAGLPPLAIIPRITLESEAPARPLKRVLVGAGVASVIIALALVAVHFLYRPLDVLWFVGLRALGIG